MNWNQLLSAQRSGETEPQAHEFTRSRFEQDYDRIIFSHPFRRLQDKTQVFPMPEDDFVHTRLTHSLEVSSVGRSLGKNAGAYLLEKYPELYQKDFRNFLKIVSIIAFEEVGFNCIFTETFDIRPNHISLLERFGFKLEGRKSQHILINGKNVDSLIHEYTRENYVKK